MSEREKIRDILDTGGSEIGKPRGLGIIDFYLMGLKHNSNFQLCNKYCIILYHATESVLIFLSFLQIILCLHEGIIIINFTPLLYLIIIIICIFIISSSWQCVFSCSCSNDVSSFPKRTCSTKSFTSEVH